MDPRMINLPARVDIERLVLGYAMQNADFLDRAVATIDRDDFSLETNRRIWRRISEMHHAGKPVDRITTYEELLAHGEAESCGGLSYLVDLDTGLPTVARFDGYLDLLREASLRRRMIAAAEHMQFRAADQGESVDDVLSGFDATMRELSRGTNTGQNPVSTRDLIQTVGVSTLLEPRRHNGIKLPWPRLDRALMGVGAGQVIVLLAATARGKTSLALQIATYAAVKGKTPAIWTLEMSPLSMVRRMVSQLAGVPTNSKQLTFQERDAQGTAVARLGEYPIYFDAHARTVAGFVSHLRQVRAQAGLGLAIVDYLQLIRGSGKNRAQEVSDNSRALKLAAMDLEIPILVLSQVDRASVKGDSKIGLHSAKESGDIENDADVLLWIEGPELSHDQDTPVALHVGKQREGPAGFSIPMIFRPAAQMFLEVAE